MTRVRGGRRVYNNPLCVALLCLSAKGSLVRHDQPLVAYNRMTPESNGVTYDTYVDAGIYGIADQNIPISFLHMFFGNFVEETTSTSCNKNLCAITIRSARGTDV